MLKIFSGAGASEKGSAEYGRGMPWLVVSEHS